MMRYISLKIAVCTILLLLSAIAASAQVKKPKTNKPKTAKPTPVFTAFTDDEISLALKDALANGINRVDEKLAKPGVFHNDPRLKIGMPTALAALEKKLRDGKHDDLVDDLVVSMNRSAEQSIPEVVYILRNTLQPMKIEDPASILAGAKDAATGYYRRSGEKVLLAKVTQMVMTSNSEAGVLEKLKLAAEKGGGLPKGFDINEYVAQKTLDGIFLTMADEEKRIREEPAARTTLVMQKVFVSTPK